MVRRRPGRAHAQRTDVFLNIPYDTKFERLYLAYLVGVSCFGLIPRATLEIPGSTRRLDRIAGLIQACRYSLHDLSRVELDRRAPATPRFNMPFELGMVVAWATNAPGKHHWFVFEARRHRIAKSLSDLSGTDVYIHDGTISGVFRELCNAFVRLSRRPNVQQMWRVYREVRRNLPQILRKAGAASPFEARVFRDVSVLASASADIHVR